MLQYLHKNWSHAGILIAIYVTLVLLCMAPYLDLFTLLVWLQFPVYLVHEFEEHTYPGGFKQFVNRTVFQVYDQDIPLTVERVFWINILAVWFLFPLTAVAAQLIHPAFGILTPCFSLVNASLHIVGAIIKRTYNPGLVASIFLNYPLGAYALFVAYDAGYLIPSYLLCALLISLGVHIALLGMALYWYRVWLKNKVV
jgi:hypothetical protein